MDFHPLHLALVRSSVPRAWARRADTIVGAVVMEAVGGPHGGLLSEGERGESAHCASSDLSLIDYRVQGD